MVSEEDSLGSQTNGGRKGLEEGQSFAKNIAVIQTREGEPSCWGSINGKENMRDFNERNDTG